MKVSFDFFGLAYTRVGMSPSIYQHHYPAKSHAKTHVGWGCSSFCIVLVKNAQIHRRNPQHHKIKQGMETHTSNPIIQEYQKCKVIYSSMLVQGQPGTHETLFKMCPN